MSYKAQLEKCTTLGKGLVLHDGLFLTSGEIQSYYSSIYLGNYEVEKIVGNLHNFLQDAKLIKIARLKDVTLAANLGTIVIHSQTLEDVLKNLAKKYFG